MKVCLVSTLLTSVVDQFNIVYSNINYVNNRPTF